MEIIDKKVALQKAFSAIGKKNGSSPPEHSDNRFGVAYELFVASDLRSQANKRYEVAKKQAEEAGVIDERETIEGGEVSTYKTKFFDVTMKRAAASSTLDKTALKNVLMRKFKCDENAAQAIIKEASKPRKGAVTIGFTLKG